MTKPPKEDILPRLKSVIEYIRDCDVRVHRGEVMELQGLDDTVLEICNGVAALPANDAKKIEPTMAVLVEVLDMLATSMKQQQDEITAAETGSRV